MIRFLLITRRRVPPPGAQQYTVLWQQLHDHVDGAGAHAWIFVSTSQAGLYTEFIEWQSSASDAIIERPDVAAALVDLNAAFPYEDSDTWQAAIF